MIFRSDIDRELGSLIALFHTSPYEPSIKRNYDLSFKLEDGLCKLSWNLDEGDGEKDNAWLMTGRKEGDAFIIVYPEPFRWNMLKKLSLEDDRLLVSWEKQDGEEPGEQYGDYEWKITVPSEIERLTRLCINRCIEGLTVTDQTL